MMKREEFESYKAEWIHRKMCYPQNGERFDFSRLVHDATKGEMFTPEQAKEIVPLAMELAVTQGSSLKEYQALISIATGIIGNDRDGDDIHVSLFMESVVLHGTSIEDDDDLESDNSSFISSRSYCNRSLLFKAVDVWTEAITPAVTKIKKVPKTIALQSIKDLISVGGKKLVLSTHRHETTLQYGLKNGGLPLDILKLMIDVGGKELLLQQDWRGQTSLHYAFTSKSSFDYIDDHDLVETTNFPKEGEIYTLVKAERIEAIKYMIHIGGKDLVLSRCNQNYTILDYALGGIKGEFCSSFATLEIVKLLVDCGGGELLISQKLFPLLGKSTSLDIVEFIVDRQGIELLYSVTEELKENFNGEDNDQYESREKEDGEKEDGDEVDYDKADDISPFAFQNLNHTSQETILHIACAYRRSNEFINYLTHIGKKRLVIMKSSNSYTALDYALAGEALDFSSSTTLEVVKMLEGVSENELTFQSKNSFHLLGRSTSLDIIQYLVRRHGKEALICSKGISKDDGTKKNTILHHVCGFRKEQRKEVIKYILDTVGHEIIYAENGMKYSPIINLVLNPKSPTMEELKLLTETLCKTDLLKALKVFPMLFESNLDSWDLVKYLIQMGGKPLVLLNRKGNSLFHAWNASHPCEEMIENLLDVGGKEVVLAKGVGGFRALEAAISSHGNKHGNPKLIELMKRMIDLGGKEILFSKARNFQVTAFSLACANDAVEIARYLCNLGGRDVLFLKGGIKMICSNAGHSREDSYSFQIIKVLIEEGRRNQIGGADGIGGLLEALVHEGIDSNTWSTLQSNVHEFKEIMKGQPILQGLIPLIFGDKVVPKEMTIKFVVKHFIDWVGVKDSNGILPIQIAAEYDMGWLNGMKDIFDATRKEVVKKSELCVGAQFGLQWKNKMFKIIKQNVAEIDKVDAETGLYPFMLAACGRSSDLSVIHDLLVTRSDVLIACIGDPSSNDEGAVRKRKFKDI